MTKVLLVVGVLMLLGGGVWILQGIGLLPGSFMTGDPFWARAGMVVALLGLAVAGAGLWLGNRRRSG